MMYLKECPKCHGDLVAGGDRYGEYLSCIQCGYMRDVPAEALRKPALEVFVIDAPKTAKKGRKKVRQAA
ncbi:MAG: hypothetical protein IH963_10005 [Chloroflexi bacterium]|nr:hypothetical protein [Chloroflexota bacterium]